MDFCSDIYRTSTKGKFPQLKMGGKGWIVGGWSLNGVGFQGVNSQKLKSFT